MRAFPVLPKQRLYQVSKHDIVPQGDTVPNKQSCLSPQLLATTNSLSVLVDWHLLNLLYAWKHLPGGLLYLASFT